MKKITALLLMLVMVFTMAACGTKSEMPKEPADIIKKAQENSQKAKNMEAKATANIDMNVAGQAIAMKMDMDMAIFMDPMKMKIDLNMDLGEELGGSQTMSVYIVKEEDKYYTYMNTMGTWMKQELDSSTMEEVLKEDSSQTDIFTNKADQFKKVESEDKEATTLEGTITGEDIKKTIDESGAMDQLNAVPGMDETSLTMFNTMMSSMGDIPIKISVDNKTVNYKTMSMDLKPMLQGLLDALIPMMSQGTEEEVTATINTCSIDIEFKNYDEATDFELPEEAKNAIDSSEALNGAINAASDGALDATVNEEDNKTE